MKKIVIIFVFFTLNFALLTFNSFAQPNGGFENWSNVNGYQDPDNWQTLNFLSLFSNPISAFKATGIDKHSGNYALKIKSIYLNNNPVSQAIPDTIGNVFTGKIIQSPPSIKLGIPYTGRPEKLEFWSKYIPVGADRGEVSIRLQKWSGTSSDTIAYGSIIVDNNSSYSLSQINLDYYSTALPDTVVITFASSYRTSEARVGSTLFIDDVAFTGWVGIDQPVQNTDKVKIFPNPARNNLSINVYIEEAENIQVLDALGKVAGVCKIQNYNASINTGTLAEGNYFFEIRDKQNRTLTKGKFNVIK